jgi:putative ABC transport system substrate-binding protein
MAVFPHQLQVGDAYTDDAGVEWTVVAPPHTYREGHRVEVKLAMVATPTVIAEMIDRRAFLGTAALLAAPRAAGAQLPGKVHRIGILQPLPNTPTANYTETVRQGLRDHGYIEGQNIAIEHRTASSPKEHAPLLSDLISRRLDVLVTWSTPAVAAAIAVTKTIPIVAITGDPVRTGLVASLAKPGGNLTGIAILTDELELKNLQLLKEAVPAATRVAVLWNPDNSVWMHAISRLKEMAPVMGMRLQPVGVRDVGGLKEAFDAVLRERADALLVVRDTVLQTGRRQITEFAARNHLPAIYGGLLFVDAGALISYGANIHDMLRRTAGYVDKILKGAKPGDLPVEQPTKFELVINLKTAKALGLTIPPSLLQRADQVLD